MVNSKHRLPLGWQLPTLGLIVLAALALGFIPGCGGGGTPEQVVAGFYKAILAGNESKAKSYCTSSYGEEEIPIFVGIWQPFTGDTEENPYAKENLTCEVSGDTARVWCNESPDVVFVLVKQDGRWKIDNIDVEMPDFSEMPEGMEMPGG